MHKISHQVDHQWVEHSYPPLFEGQITASGTKRLRIGVPGGDPCVLLGLLGCLEEPFLTLYVKHTSRDDGELGRYQSPALPLVVLEEFVRRFGPFLGRDARHDFWVHCESPEATLVWDRHNELFAYGPLDCFRSKLIALGFSETPPQWLVDHIHHYNAEFDQSSVELLSAFDWIRTPLRPEDEQ